MRLLECGHAAVAGSPRVCEHLLVEDPADSYRVLTGSGVRYDLACAECVEGPLLTVCEGCVEDAAGWTTNLGWKGTPEIRHEDRAVAGTRRSEPCDVQPLNDRCFVLVAGGWLAVTAYGLAGPDGFRCDVPLVLPGEGRPSPALHVSADGRYAAVVHDYGQKGVVLDMRSGEVVARLDRGDYHNEVTRFPIAFLPGDRMVAATRSNRLDVFDLTTGKVVTVRDDGRGQHMHGELKPSPSGRWLAVDSWIWHPVGVPRILDVHTWLRDGGDPPSVDLSHRAYAWGQPIAWVTPDVVAVQRIGEDDELMIDGVELYAVPGGRRVGAFAGPAGPMWGHEGFLYVAGADGLEVWDPERGARIGLVQGFRPTAHRDDTFVSLDDGVLNSFSVD